MEVTVLINKYKNIRYNFFRWRFETSLINKVALATFFCCIIGLLSQIRFYLPGNPVPITGQTFGVLLAGVILGKLGAASVGLYAALGAAGVPWFAPRPGMGIFSNGGIGAILGPTGGYIIGFVIAAFFVGCMVDKYIKYRKFYSLLALMLIANFVIIYIPGLIALYIWTNNFIGNIGLFNLLKIGAIPFIPGDLIKVLLATVTATIVLPKISYGREVDG